MYAAVLYKYYRCADLALKPELLCLFGAFILMVNARASGEFTFIIGIYWTVIWMLWIVDVTAGINEDDVSVWNFALSVAEPDEGT